MTRRISVRAGDGPAAWRSELPGRVVSEPRLFVVPGSCTDPMGEIMRYWDEDHAEWTPDERDFAAAWRRQPKRVVARSLQSVGPNATLVRTDIEAVIRGLTDELAGESDVGGPDLARS